jgi:hypothetical protein
VEAWRALQEAEKSAPAFQSWLVSSGCEWAIATRVRERLGGYRLLHGPQWALVYWDDASEVFVRRDVARFAAVRDRLEYRHFRPWGGSILGSLEKLERPDLLQLLAETSRFLQSSPGDALALVERCAALTRLGSDERAQACDDAAARVPPAAGPLLAKARSLQAAP